MPIQKKMPISRFKDFVSSSSYDFLPDFRDKNNIFLYSDTHSKDNADLELDSIMVVCHMQAPTTTTTQLLKFGCTWGRCKFAIILEKMPIKIAYTGIEPTISLWRASTFTNVPTHPDCLWFVSALITGRSGLRAATFQS